MEDWVENDVCIDGLGQVQVHQLLSRDGLPRPESRARSGTGILLHGEPAQPGSGSHLLRHHVNLFRGGPGSR